MTLSAMDATLTTIATTDKGILAADESNATIKKRLDSIATESTETSRRDYRELLFTADGIEKNISGVILFDETIRQMASNDTPLADILASKGIVPGIKVDKGLVPLADGSIEKATQGLDGLGDRLVEYKKLGARFAKWRAVYSITDDLPSAYCVQNNAQGLARYAFLCQQNGIVPIVEPEVLMDGSHTLERCEAVTTEVLHAVFNALFDHGVSLEHMILKPNMVISGSTCKQQASPEQVAEATLRCFRRTVPAAVRTIMFLSGGQSDEQATANLNAINAIAKNDPWYISFSYGRALQAPCLSAWQGKPENIAVAQQEFLKRARLNGAATTATYSNAME